MRGMARLISRSKNSHMRSPRSVTLAPMALPSRSLKPAIDFLALVTSGFWPVIVVRSRDRALEQRRLLGGRADAHVDDDLLEAGDLHDVAEARAASLSCVADLVVVALLAGAGAGAWRSVSAHQSSPPALRQMRTLLPSVVEAGSRRGSAAVARADDGDVGRRGIGMSLSMIPPCMVARVGFWCFLAMLTPSTMTLPSLGEGAHDLALLAPVLAGEHAGPGRPS